MPRASILVPTHNHASTLPITVASALGQTVEDIEILIIGDGVTADVHSAAAALVEADARVRFLDLPKGKNHGEPYRDLAIREAESDAIFYLCDDDILMPTHVADLLELLEHHTFVQSKNGYFRPDGSVFAYPGDLADPTSLQMVMRDDRIVNFVSITGTAHSRDFYLRANQPWTVTPTDLPPDWYQWRKLLSLSTFSGATSHRMTALQFPSGQDGRAEWTGDMRRDEIVRWATLAGSPGGQDEIDSLVARGDRATVTRQQWELLELEIALGELREWASRPSIRTADAIARAAHRFAPVRRR
jgi:hypothetical protein